MEQLVEAWDFQRRFAGERAEKLPSDDQAHAPKFSHFVPGKSRPPPKYMDPSPGPLKGRLLQTLPRNCR